MSENTRLFRRTRFAMVANDAARDRNLSIEARGLLTLLLSYSDGWRFRQKYLQEMCECSRDKYYRMVNELKEHGYLRTEREFDPVSRRILGWSWFVTDEPEGRFPENPYYGKSGSIRRPSVKKSAPPPPLLDDDDPGLTVSKQSPKPSS